MRKGKRTVQLKGSKGGLVAHLDSSSSLEEIKSELSRKLAEGGVFFNGARVRLDLGGRQGHPEEIDEIRMLFTGHGLAFDGIVPREEPALEKMREGQGDKETGALIIRRTLRSGQKITHRGSVIILGDVNPGAEIAAGGDIVVLGKLRGVAHAGVSGDNQVTVAALSLNPSQLRIGQYLARAPDQKEDGGSGPEWARLHEGRIVISPLNKD